MIRHQVRAIFTYRFRSTSNNRLQANITIQYELVNEKRFTCKARIRLVRNDSIWVNAVRFLRQPYPYRWNTSNTDEWMQRLRDRGPWEWGSTIPSESKTLTIELNTKDNRIDPQPQDNYEQSQYRKMTHVLCMKRNVVCSIYGSVLRLRMHTITKKWCLIWSLNQLFCHLCVPR